MGVKIIEPKRGKFVRNFYTDPLAKKYVDIEYRRRGRLGKILKLQTIKRVNLPRGVKITSIENNAPRVGAVKISYIKIKKNR